MGSCNSAYQAYNAQVPCHHDASVLPFTGISVAAIVAIGLLLVMAGMMLRYYRLRD